MKKTELLSNFADNLAASVKSVVKMAVQSRPSVCRKPKSARPLPLIVMGNGPSLADTLRLCRTQLEAFPLLAVNFAAIAPEFRELRPEYYVLADPHFFSGSQGENLAKLRESLASVDWPMTLFVPVRKRSQARELTSGNPSVSIATFNPVAVEGFKWLERAAFGAGLGMPRPRNVLIPALMVAMSLGFRTIYVAGADHSWMKTLEVTEDNIVVTVQPHFYADSDDEKARITSVYKDVRLHEILQSFYVAFRSYFAIARYASRLGVRIINVTPGSYIDAFERCNLAAVSVRPDEIPNLRAENSCE